MDDALLRSVAVLQAKSVLLDNQSNTLTELSDMQVLRGFKSSLAEYISDHVQKGTLPSDPLAAVKKRLEQIIEVIDRIRDQESAIDDVAKDGLNNEKIWEDSLQLLQFSQGKLDVCRPALHQMHIDLFEGSMPGDWEGEVGERRICPELRDCAAVLFPGKDLGYRESSLGDSVKKIDGLSLRIGSRIVALRERVDSRMVALKELHAVQAAVFDQVSAFLKHQDFHSAIHVLKENKMIADQHGNRLVSLVNPKDTPDHVSDIINNLIRFTEVCRDLNHVASGCKNGFIINGALDRARKFLTSPGGGGFAREVNPLIICVEEKIKGSESERTATAKKWTATVKKQKYLIVSIAVLVLVICTIFTWSSKAIIRELADVRDEFRVAQGEGGTVVAWGSNDSGQTTVPADLDDVVQVAAGMTHSLALLKDGTVVAWGSNDFDQVTVPASLEFLGEVVQVAAGGLHSLALLKDGTVVAWGDNRFGQSTVPAKFDDVVQVATGGSHSLALLKDGTVVAFGRNDFGQSRVPAGLDFVVQIAAGGSHSLALRDDGTVVAWGDGMTASALLDDVVQVAGGVRNNLALRDDGTVVSVIALSGKIRRMHLPLHLDDVVQVAVGGSYSLSLRKDGTVVGWGDGEHLAHRVPAGLNGVVQIVTGGYHSLALKRK